MRLTGYPTSCLTLAVTLVKTTRQQRETLPIAGFALDADKWSGTGIHLGRYKGNDLVYAGKVDHGFTPQSEKELHDGFGSFASI